MDPVSSCHGLLALELKPGDSFAMAVGAAHRVRQALDELGLVGAVKTSGAKGIHVFVPIAATSMEDVAAATRALAARAEQLEIANGFIAKVGLVGFMDEGQAAFKAGLAAFTVDGTFRLGAFKPITDFTWGVTEVGGLDRFKCQLDSGAFEPCASGKSFDDLPCGGHTFTVRGRDKAGNVGPVEPQLDGRGA